MLYLQIKYKNEEIMRNITLMLTREQMISDVTKAVEIRQSQALLESGNEWFVAQWFITFWFIAGQWACTGN